MRSIFAAILVLILTIIVLTVLSVWPIMLLLGAVGSFLTWVPILSFWQTFLAVLLISYLGAVFNPKSFIKS